MENQNQSTAPRGITVNDKAEAFDRIAAAFLDIPVGNPGVDEVEQAKANLFEVTQREIVAIHPAYGGPHR